MRSYFRLLPLTIFFACMLLAVKVGQAIESGESLFDRFIIGAVAAQEEAQKADKEADTKPEAAAEKAEEAPEENKADSGAEKDKPETTAEEKTQEPDEGGSTEEPKKETAEEKKDGADKKADAKDAKGEKTDKDAKGEKPAEKTEAGKGDEEDDTFFKPIFEGSKKVYRPEDLIGNQLGGTRPDDRRFSPVELQLLQQLSDRRIKLDEREKDLALKENLLRETEVRVNEKFDEMATLKTELAELIRRYNEIEETKLRSLVKIYENMKPKDAARIFDEIEMPVLLLVIDQMSERKAAPILANMDSKKAKQVTVELAEQRRLQDEKLARERAAQEAAQGATQGAAPGN